MSDPAIRLSGVSKRYGTQLALETTTMDIEEGEFFCLLGPSGCGKTTTLNLIGGFVAPTGGEIWIRGERVDRLPPHKRSVNTVFQSYALFPHMTVGDNVGFGLKMARVARTESRSRIEEALALVGLEKHADRLPSQLSGGQQQRVAVARALVNRPAVLLLDEPLGALDLKLRKRLQIELAQIHREIGTTFVYVTHDQEEAMSMATRIAVLNDGRIQQIGTPEQIYRRPNSRFVADFIGESNFVDIDLTRSTNGRVYLADGTPVPCATPPPAGGDWATLMVRPESIHLSASGDAPAEKLRGRIVQTSFLGSLTRVAIACDAVSVPMVAVLSGRDLLTASDLAPDTEVSLWWQPSDAVLLDESEFDKGGRT
jgi:spermidine/putrescine ABC transporter ATP-binding subunit